jgi:hypothetical protein
MNYKNKMTRKVITTYVFLRKNVDSEETLVLEMQLKIT